VNIQIYLLISHFLVKPPSNSSTHQKGSTRSEPWLLESNAIPPPPLQKREASQSKPLLSERKRCLLTRYVKTGWWQQCNRGYSYLLQINFQLFWANKGRILGNHPLKVQMVTVQDPWPKGSARGHNCTCLQHHKATQQTLSFQPIKRGFTLS